VSKIDQTLLYSIGKMAKLLIRRYAQVPGGFGFPKGPLRDQRIF
jgi:hypothetical protein